MLIKSINCESLLDLGLRRLNSLFANGHSGSSLDSSILSLLACLLLQSTLNLFVFNLQGTNLGNKLLLLLKNLLGLLLDRLSLLLHQLDLRLFESCQTFEVSLQSELELSLSDVNLAESLKTQPILNSHELANLAVLTVAVFSLHIRGQSVGRVPIRRQDFVHSLFDTV